ncbi:MAG: glycoside hydrolase family 31 protein [Candidatus Thorarchaeota archaeon]
MSKKLGPVHDIGIQKNHVDYSCENGKARITVVSPKIVRVQVTRDEHYRQEPSVAAVDRQQNVSLDFRRKNGASMISWRTFTLAVTLEDAAIRIEDQTGSILIETPAGFGLGWHDDSFVCRIKSSGGEYFYGMGEKTNGLDKSGLHYEMWNNDNPHHDSETDPLYQSVPFFITLRDGTAHGIFFDNTFRTQFDFRQQSDDFYSFGAPGGPIDYYVILGPSIAEVLDGYTWLTGRPHFMPLWALGHHWSRWAEYESQEEVLNVASAFRKHNIPCDTITLDIGYMDEFKIFTWNPEVFPNPRGFVKKLTDLDYHVMAIIDPGIKLEEGYRLYDEGIENDFFLKEKDGKVYVGLVWPGRTVFPDFYREEVREWFASQYEDFMQSGLSNASWLDMNEPSNCMYPGLREEYSMKDVVDSKGRPWEPRMRNRYALDMMRAVFDGLKEVFPDERPFILTRAGFAGYQRYAATWTGDNHSTWEYLALSIPMLLNLGLSGIPFCGADIGGFSDDVTQELLIRWYQLGSLYPFSRNHTRINTSRQEPWELGEEAIANARKYISFRYRFLRYFYYLAKQANDSGLPIMRPLVLEFQDDPTTYEIDDQFMIGSSMMAAPVLEKGAENRSVYFPPGEWFDYWTNERIEGGQRITVSAPLDTMPVYFRGGSVVPTGDVVQTTDKDQGDLRILVYPEGEDCIELYEDDGISEAGPSAVILMSTSCDEDSLSIHVSERRGDWTPPSRNLIIEFRAVAEEPRTIQVDGTTIPVDFASANGDQDMIVRAAAYHPETSTFEIELEDDGAAHKLSFRK